MKLRKILLTLLLLSPMLTLNCSSPSSKVYLDDLRLMLESGVVPDVVYVDAVNAPEFIGRHWLKPIPGDLVAKDDFYSQLLPYFQHDGQLYAVPVDFAPVLLLVNAGMFEKYGLEYPNTWDELEQVGRVMQERQHAEGNTDFRAVGLTTGFWNFLPYLYQAGGSLVDTKTGMLALQTDAAKNAFARYTGLSRGGLAYSASGDDWPYQGVSGDTGIVARFEEGKIAICFGGTRIYETLKRRGLPVKAIEPLAGPAGRQTVALVRGYGLFGDPATPASPAAVEFLSFITSEKNMARWIGDKETPLDSLPARSKLQGAWLDVHPDTTAFMNSLKYLPSDYQVSPVNFAAIEALNQLASEKISLALAPEVSETKALESLDGLQQEGNAILLKLGRLQ
jgi:ABC-type glycerol-3-phosphate transport system substrate-binding protein